MVARRSLPSEVLGEQDWFLWRAVAFEAPLRHRLNSAPYDTWTFAPPFVSEQELARVQLMNRRWEAEPSGTWEAVLGYLEARIRDTGATWVVPDCLAEVTDPHFNPSSEYFVVGATPYYVTREANTRLIEQAWRDGGSAAGELGLLTLADVPRTKATEQQLENLAERTSDLVVEAYDHPQRVIFFTHAELAAT